MNPATLSNASFWRMLMCVIPISTVTFLNSVEAQTSDAELAILRAREASGSMRLRKLEEKIRELERNERRNEPLYGSDDLVLNSVVGNRRDMERIRSAKAVGAFRNELDVAKEQLKDMELVLKIIQLSEKYPDALTDPAIKDVVYIATVEGLSFLNAFNEEKRRKRAQKDLRVMAKQLRLYQSDNGTLPTSEQGLASLVATPISDPRPRHWRQLLERVPLDPWGEPYIYRSEEYEFVVASSGPDRQEGNEDDLLFSSAVQEKSPLASQ